MVETRQLGVIALIVALDMLQPQTTIAADVVDETTPGPNPTSLLPLRDTPWYIGARIGAAFAEDTTLPAFTTRVEGDYDPGYNLALSVGYQFLSQSPLAIRTELELGYTRVEIDNQTLATGTTFSGSSVRGNTSAIYGLANAYIDYDLGLISPFVTAGAGYGTVNFDGQRVIDNGLIADDAGTGFAWQLGIGAAYSLSETLSLDLGYRYLGIENVGITAADGSSAETDFRNHLITLGVRKSF